MNRGSYKLLIDYYGYLARFLIVAKSDSCVCSWEVLKVAAICQQAHLGSQLHIQQGPVDHGRVQGSHLLVDVGLQLVLCGRAGAVNLIDIFI